NNDIYFLRQTFLLASKAEGLTSPNPLVGAIIVKNNKIISCGFHKKAGGAHAEIEAIKKAKQNLRGATLYINLEPCCHFGKTPPCVDEIIKTGIKQAVISTVDPNPKICGNSIKKMKAAGIKISLGLLKDEAEKINEVFFKNMKENRAFVVAKVAQTLDGKIATSAGVSKWITTESSRKFAKSLRDKYDSILVGINTVLKDNPRLNGLKKIPYKVVIDPHLRIDKKSFIVRNHPEKLIIFTSKKAKTRKAYKDVRIFAIDEKKGKLDLNVMLKILFNLGIASCFVEGGSQTLGNFLDEKLIDKMHFFISPKIVGGKNALTSIGAKGYETLSQSPHLKEIEIKRIGQDILITGYPCYDAK
ncbi:MAG: bifunctional diaminohydroxyphosphoribosylaminopyrimidine deaminase/5-amino-6-(5-phosphoribosylamino)uracil reductase RibD, partial [Candidatus Omnitrophota bacterium]